MNARQAYGRLLARPMTLVNVGAALAMALAVGAGSLLLGRAAGWVEGTGLPSGTSSRQLARLAHLLVPAALGIAAAFPAQEIQYSPLSWNLPGLRGALARGVLAVATLVAVGAALCAPFSGASLPLAAAAGLACAGWALGTRAFDPVPRRWASRLALAGLLLLPAAVGPLCDSAARRPWVTLGIGIALVAGASYELFGRAPAAARARTPRWSLPLSFRRQEELERWSGALSPIRGTERAFRVENVRAARFGLVRAALYESYGRFRFGWPGQALWIAAIMTAIAATIAFQRGLGLEGRWEHGWIYVHRAFVEPELSPPESYLPSAPTYVTSLLGVAALAMGCLSGGPSLSPALTPVARRTRARALWLAELYQTTVLCLAVAACFFVVSELSVAASGVTDPGGPLPGWLRAIVVLWIVSPIVPELRRRFTVPRGPGASLWVGARAGLATLGLTLLVGALREGWREVDDLLPWSGWLALAFASGVCLQWVRRGVLERDLARRDLVARGSTQ